MTKERIFNLTVSKMHGILFLDSFYAMEVVLYGPVYWAIHFQCVHF